MTPRILDINGTKVHVGRCGYTNEAGREVWEWHVRFPDGTEDFAEDLYAPRIGEVTERGMLSTLLIFLGACAESWDESPENRGEYAELFPEAVARWAAANDDEISCVQTDLEEEVVA